MIGKLPLLATQLDFSASKYPVLQAYQQGFVKEGVGAGGCAIAQSDRKFNRVSTKLLTI